MKARRSDWAPLVPWSGIQDKPSYLQDDGIPYSAIIDFPDPGGGLATVAYTGLYSDLLNKPTLGSAAAHNASDFATAHQGSLADTALQPPDDTHFQSGTIDFSDGTRDYPVVFSPEMAGVPEIDTQQYMSDGTSEMFYNSIYNADTMGFTLKLNTAPTVAAGWCFWRAYVRG